MSDEVIRVGEVSKRFRIPKVPSRTMKEAVIRFLKRRLEYDEFWALKGVDFSVKKGEAVGIIGRNGSGKSTLFKLISGVLTPTSGSVDVKGRLSPLIELSAGFHPELTGIENIYLNCAIYGMSKSETMSKLDGIIEFAGIGNFIYSPVRMYSSGMMARLAFAVAVNVDAENLLIDEVLAVGDADFQKKCYAKIRELKGRQVSIVYVSHDLGSVTKLCDRVIWLDAGKIRQSGDPKEVVSSYYNFVTKASGSPTTGDVGKTSEIPKSFRGKES